MKENQNPTVIPLHPRKHANLVFTGCNGCIKCCDGKLYTSANLLVSEMFDTARLFPVFFTWKDNLLNLSLLYSLQQGVPCPYLDMEKRQCGVYDSVRPRACKIYPFNIREVRKPSEQNSGNIDYSVILDTRCPAVGTGKPGIPIIENNALSGRILNDFIDPETLGQYRENLLNTWDFLRTVASLDLLEELDYDAASTPPVLYGENNGFSGMRVWKISEKKLAALPDDAVMMLHRKGFFNAIYTHLNSLKNMKKLMQIRDIYNRKKPDILTFRF